MRTALTSTAVALAIAAQGLFVQGARAEAAEFFNCSMADGTSMDQLVELANDFEAVTVANGLENFRVAFLTPLYSSNLADGNFWWVGVADSYAGAAMANEIWDSEAGDEIRARWDALVTGCASSSLHRLTMTPNEEAETAD